MSRLRRLASARPFRPERPPTCLQEAENALRELVLAVIENLSDEEAAAWFAFLVETAARHGRRAEWYGS